MQNVAEKIQNCHRFVNLISTNAPNNPKMTLIDGRSTVEGTCIYI